MRVVSLEGQSRWRAAATAGILLLVVLPTLTMVSRSLGAASDEVVRASFMTALQNSILVGVAVVIAAVSIGLPVGVLVSRYLFAFREIALGLIALPLLLPTFLWAIGWSSILNLSGFAGSILAFAAPSVSLVVLTTLVAAQSLSESQVEAALLAGGERAVLMNTFAYVAIPASSAALLAGLLSLSDPGPGQVFGLRTASAEILTSFSALYDFNLASRQCLALAGVVTAAAIPFALLMGPRLASEIISKQTRPAQSSYSAWGSHAALIATLAFSGAFLAVPLLGLTRPALGEQALSRAWAELVRTAESTVVYAVGSGMVATLLGIAFAVTIGRSERLELLGIASCFTLLTIPPAVTALAFVQAGTQAPAWTDFLFRSRLAVTLALGARLFPVAAVIALRAWNSMPRTWAFAGAVHGVPFLKYFRLVVLPFLAPSIVISIGVCGLLATADIVTVLLVHPPGQSSLPLSIFTIMANAPQSFVAGLCLIYAASAAVLLSVIWAFDKRRSW